jgi:hypothetical protein
MISAGRRSSAGARETAATRRADGFCRHTLQYCDWSISCRPASRFPSLFAIRLSPCRRRSPLGPARPRPAAPASGRRRCGPGPSSRSLSLPARRDFRRPDSPRSTCRSTESVVKSQLARRQLPRSVARPFLLPGPAGGRLHCSGRPHFRANRAPTPVVGPGSGVRRPLRLVAERHHRLTGDQPARRNPHLRRGRATISVAPMPTPTPRRRTPRSGV